MSRWQWLLIGLIGVELAVAAVLLVRHQQPTIAPPVPPRELFDDETSAALSAARDQVRPAAAEDWAHLAELYLAHGYYPEAEACHRRACELAPKDAELRALWAFCLSRMGDMEQAVPQFRQAIKQGHPRPRELHYFAARDLLRLGDIPAAREALLDAGDLPAARYERAKLELAEKDAAQAVRLLEPLQQEFPAALPSHWLRGRAERMLGRHAEAERFERRAAEVGGRLPTPFDRHSDRIYDAHHRLGLARRWKEARRLLDAGRLADARRLLEQGLAIRWQAPGADLLAEVAYEQGDVEGALQLLREILDRVEPSQHHWWRYGDTLEAAGRRDEAAEAWHRAVTLGPETEGRGLYVKLSQYHAERGEAAEAERFRARFYYAAGVERLRAGQPAEALASLEEAVSIFPQDPDAWYYLAECRRRLGNAAEAGQAYRRCLELRPQHGRAFRALASAEKKAGPPAAAH